MIAGGHAMSHDLGPSMGRTTGVDADQPVSHSAGPQAEGGQEGHGGHGTAGIAPNARQVPGYPQDMWMPMDKEVEKPETYGLRPTWTGAMMGMMTLIRVLKPEMFDKIQEMKKAQAAGGGR